MRGRCEEQLLAALRGAAEGVTLVMPSITRRLVERFAQVTAPPAPSRRPHRPRARGAAALARRMSNAEIAGSLSLGGTTEKTHVSRLLLKLELTSRTQAVVVAY